MHRRSWTRSSAAAFATLAALAAGVGCADDRGPAQRDRAQPRGYEVHWARAQRLAAENALRRRSGGLRQELTDALREAQIAFAASVRFVVCGSLTETAQRELSALDGRRDFQGCKNVIADASGRRRRADLATAVSAVESVRIEDGYAAMRVVDPDGAARTIPLVMEGPDGWGFTSFAYVDPTAVRLPARGPGPDAGDPAGASDRVAIEEVVYDVQAQFPRSDGAGVCSELTPQGRREVVAAAGRRSCPAAVEAVAEQAAGRGFQPRTSAILDVVVDGDRAVAVLKDRSDRGKPAYRVPLVRSGGAWRLPSLTAVEPIDLEPPRRGPRIVPDPGDPPGLDAEGKVRELVTDTQADFAAAMPTFLCADLSPRGQRELLALARDRDDECKDVAYDIATWNRRHGVGPRFSRILSVDLDGSWPNARVADPGRPPYEIPLVRVGTGWALESLAHVVPIADALAHLRRLRASRIGGS